MHAMLLSALLIGQLPDKPYDGPRYFDRGDTITLNSESMIMCFQAGFSPEFIEKHFGSPLLTDQFRQGPVSWYSKDVTLRWPPSVFEPPAKRVVRVHGGII